MSRLSEFTPICGKEKCTPGKKDRGFKLWNIKVIQTVIDLYKDGVLILMKSIRPEIYTIQYTYIYS